ncbi:hypothetical protein [Acidocella aminolytica]|uniref:hypothetical protein n=1 Tax=Acidocella aminolytica TaxID=33998 RepID=UPI000662535E|nr:hypothetical protein [Acidocella aminolytica]
MSGARRFDPWAAIGKKPPVGEARERRLDAETEQAERAAIQNEPQLPPPGSEERRVIDLAHERMVRGLLKTSLKNSKL